MDSMSIVQCIGVVSGCCCKEVYLIDILTIIFIINFSYSTCISSFFLCFFRSYIYR